MHQNSYEDYMKYLLGYSCDEGENNDIKTTTYDELIEVGTDDSACPTEEQFIELYPDIYKTVYPMVCKACMNVNTRGTITEELVMQLTNEVYEALEEEEKNQPKQETHVQVHYANGMNYRNQRSRRMQMQDSNQESRETRQRNFLLNDLIRILVLRELLGERRPPRPPYRPGPPRPPRPPMRPDEGPPRPPMPPRPPRM